MSYYTQTGKSCVCINAIFLFYGVKYLLVSIARLVPSNRLRMRKQYGQLNENAISLIPSENALK